MINISVKTLEKSKKGAYVECRGAITGNGGDIRREMIAALQMFDEVADGNILCDAFDEFLAIKMKGEGEDDD